MEQLKNNYNWESIWAVKNFNDRKCNCYDSEDEDEDEDYNEKLSYRNYSNDYLCCNENKCNCDYPINIESPLMLSLDDKKEIIENLKNKNYKLRSSDIDWEHNGYTYHNYDEHNKMDLIDKLDEIDKYIINLYSAESDIINMYKIYLENKMKITEINYNILKIFSGMGDLVE